jgi:hypothetical protein
VNYKKGCTQLAVASDKVYQLLAHRRWFSLGTPASSTTKTGRIDIHVAEIKRCFILHFRMVDHFMAKRQILASWNEGIKS